MTIAAPEVRAILSELNTLAQREIRTRADLDLWYREARVLDQRIRACALGSVLPEVIWHFLADADIRFKDHEYARMQQEQVRVALAELTSVAGGA